MARTKQHGKGAIVSALSRFIHPSEHIRNKFPTPVHGHWLVGCYIATRSEKGKLQGPVVPRCPSRSIMMTSRMMMTSKSTQIDCQAVNTQQIPQEARGKAHEPKKEHKG